MGYLNFYSGTLGGRLGSVVAWQTYDGQKHPPSYVSYPTVGVGNMTVGAQNFLNGAAVMPTFNVATLCGYFNYVGQTGDYEGIVSFHGDNSNPYYFLGVNANSDVSYAYTNTAGLQSGPTLTQGRWYFWVMQNDGANNFSAYLVEAGTALTTPTWSGLNIATANAAALNINAYAGGLSPAIGFHARCRAWSSVLSLAELNAERVSAAAVKAGHTYDAALDTLSALDGLTINNTLITGPGGPLVGVGQTTTNGSNYLSRSTSLPTYNSTTVCGFFYFYDVPAADETMISVAYAAGGGHTWFGINSSYQVIGWDSTGGYTGVILYPVARTWFFYVLQINGTTATYRAVPAGASITTASPQSITVPAGQTTSEIHSLQSNTLSSPATGFSARIRAWSSILNDTELDAERLSATAVKAGSLFDAPLTTTSDLGGFTIAGTLTTGP